MFFFARTWGDPAWIDTPRAARSLGLFAGHNADQCREGADFFCELPAPRAAPRPGWRAARAPSGAPVLLLGWIDNLDELAGALGCAALPEQVYGAAVERWGSDADARVIGEYASLVARGDGTVRMARSPWASFPLFFHLGRHGLCASSVVRPMFAAGLPKRLRAAEIERLVAFELPSGTTGQFEGIEQVPGGSVVIAGRDRWTAHSYYDPLAVPKVRLRRDADYVDAANAMLAEAAAKALKLAEKPAITLSGGLDSPIVCDELLRQIPPPRRLTSVTFEPLGEWDGRCIPGLIGSDRPYAEEFIRTHPRLDPIFTQNRGIDFLSHGDALFMAGDAGYPARVIGLAHLGVMEAARDAGCDWLFSAGIGNLTFSTEAPWASAEFFRSLRWGELVRLERGRIADPRPLWRRLAASAIMPNLPAPLHWAIRDLVHRGAPAELVTNPYLAPDGPLGAKLRVRNARENIADPDFHRSRRRLIRNIYGQWWRGGEAGLGAQQVFGIRARDVLSYRPFIELCLGMPTSQFVRRGERRFLARRMAEGRLPEAQRSEVRHADHLPDWHARMTPMLPLLREEARRIAAHPVLAPLLDTGRIAADIENWPAAAPTDIASVTRLRFALPAMIQVRRYLDFASGRNPE